MRASQLLLLSALFFALLLTGCNGKTAVINTNMAFQMSDAGKEGVAYLDRVGTELQASLAEAEKQAQTNKNKNVAMLKFQQRLAEAQHLASSEQQHVMTIISEHLRSTLNAYREKNNIAVIIDAEAAAAYSPKADITQKIIQEMNKTAVTFQSPTATPAMEAAPAEAAPAQ